MFNAMGKVKHETYVGFKLPSALKGELDKVVSKTGFGISGIMRNALIEWLENKGHRTNEIPKKKKVLSHKPQ